MADTAPTPAELTALLAHLLAGAAGGTEARWASLIAPLTRKHLSFGPATNWSVTPTGTEEEQDAITRAVAIVRGEHPYVTW